MKVKEKNSKAYEINKKIRRQWAINPITRIKQNDKRDTKKRRQKENTMIKIGRWDK